MIINTQTKIGQLLKAHPLALDYLIKISPKFTKLRNPLLRKIIGARTTIAMAAKIGDCTTDLFFETLKPLGFTKDLQEPEVETPVIQNELPSYLKNMPASKIKDLDVRRIIDEGGDPLSLIINSVKELPEGTVLKIINSFEPTPLVKVLGKKGFVNFMHQVDEQTVHAYFYKNEAGTFIAENNEPIPATDWDKIYEHYKNKFVTINVQNLEMPEPMHKILDNLNTLPKDYALLVQHKRIPVFLLPELIDRKFEYRIKEEQPGTVWLLIFKEN